MRHSLSRSQKVWSQHSNRCRATMAERFVKRINYISVQIAENHHVDWNHKLRWCHRNVNPQTPRWSRSWLYYLFCIMQTVVTVFLFPIPVPPTYQSEIESLSCFAKGLVWCSRFRWDLCLESTSKLMMKKSNIVLSNIFIDLARLWLGNLTKNFNVFITDTNVVQYKRVNSRLLLSKLTQWAVMNFILSTL